MTSLLKLAADFFERMSNPVYGIEVNQSYEHQLSELLRPSTSTAEWPSATDTGLNPRFGPNPVAKRLAEEATQLSNINDLSPHGWNWLLGWAMTGDVVLNDDLLLSLCEASSVSSFKAKAIEVATLDSDVVPTVLDVHEFGHPWLRELMTNVTEQTPDPTRLDVFDEPLIGRVRAYRVPHSDHAEQLLMALLQVGSEIALNAAASLLQTSWSGQEQLRQSMEEWLITLDWQTARAWRRRLGIL